MNLFNNLYLVRQGLEAFDEVQPQDAVIWAARCYSAH